MKKDDNPEDAPSKFARSDRLRVWKKRASEIGEHRTLLGERCRWEGGDPKGGEQKKEGQKAFSRGTERKKEKRDAVAKANWTKKSRGRKTKKTQHNRGRSPSRIEKRAQG